MVFPPLLFVQVRAERGWDARVATGQQRRNPSEIMHTTLRAQLCHVTPPKAVEPQK